jgi:hypothetical protein
MPDRTAPRVGDMDFTLLIVAILATGAYAAGYLIGRSDGEARRDTSYRYRRLEQHIEQLNLDRSGNPRLN